MNIDKLLRYLREEAGKLPRRVRTVRVYLPEDGSCKGCDVNLETSVVLPFDALGDQVDWMINLTDNDDFDGEEVVPCTPHTVGPLVVP